MIIQAIFLEVINIYFLDNKFLVQKNIIYNLISLCKVPSMTLHKLNLTILHVPYFSKIQSTKEDLIILTDKNH